MGDDDAAVDRMKSAFCLNTCASSRCEAACVMSILTGVYMKG